MVSAVTMKMAAIKSILLLAGIVHVNLQNLLDKQIHYHCVN